MSMLLMMGSGNWGTTDKCLVLVCSLFTNKDGKSKTGFAGLVRNIISALRLLKPTPLDSHMAGTNNKFRGA